MAREILEALAEGSNETTLELPEMMSGVVMERWISESFGV